MNKEIEFYEVENKHGRWLASYSSKFDNEINVGCSGLGMAIITAKHNPENRVLAVSKCGLREIVWPII